MTVSEGAVDATFAALGIDATYTPAGGEPVPVRVIARRPDTIVGFGDTRIHAETATFEVRASEILSPRAGDQLTVGGQTFVVRSEPERRDPTGWSGRQAVVSPADASSPRLPVLAQLRRRGRAQSYVSIIPLGLFDTACPQPGKDCHVLANHLVESHDAGRRRCVTCTPGQAFGAEPIAVPAVLQVAHIHVPKPEAAKRLAWIAERWPGEDRIEACQHLPCLEAVAA